MTSTTKMISLADLIPANERPEDIHREYGRHTVHEMPSRSFLLRHPDPRYGMMESCVMSWTPGVLTIGGDLGDLVLSHRAFETLEGGLSWLSRSNDIQYLASKSNARKEYQADAARALIVDDLLTGLRDELYQSGLIGADNQIPDPLPADFGWDDVQPWVRLAENYGIPLDEFLTASGREEALRMVLNEEELGEHSQFAAFYSEIFGDDEVPYSGSHDYEPTVIRRIQMARAFATVILATPEFAPKEEEPAPEPAPMP